MEDGIRKEKEETVKKLPVIANQSADWCGDPLNFRETWVF